MTLLTTLIYSFLIVLTYSSCNNIYGICNSNECPLDCTVYCNSQGNNSNVECCCEQIIISGLTCTECFRSNYIHNSNQHMVFGIELSKQALSPDVTIDMILFWNNSRFKCTTSSPTSIWEFYSCDAVDDTSCSTVITPNFKNTQYGLLINTDNINIEINRVVIKNIKNSLVTNLYIIDNFYDYNNSFIHSHDTLITFNQLNENEIFMDNMQAFVQQNQNRSIECASDNLLKTAPEGIDFNSKNSEICVVGSIHSFLNGNYKYVAWNNETNNYGPIYYNDLQNKYLYWHTTEESEAVVYSQMGDDYSSKNDFGYTRCPMMIKDPNRYDVTKCTEWRTDINGNPQVEEFQKETHIRMERCHDNLIDDQKSVTFGFHINEFWRYDDSTLSMTLFWNGNKYKCTVYPRDYDAYDSYYTCNTIFSAMKCNGNYNFDPYPIEFGLHFDIFRDDEEREDAWAAEQIGKFGIDSIIFEYMIGNVVHNTNIIQHFCWYDSSNETCQDILWITDPHILIQYDIPNENYSIELKSNVSHPTTFTHCVPDNKTTDIEANKYVLVALEKSWDKAHEYCQHTYNSGLATIITDNDLNYAVALREALFEQTHSHKDIWIGLNDLNPNTVWEWVDGTPCTYVKDDDSCVNDPHWSPDEPDDEPFEACAEMSSVTTFGHFNDEICSETNYFLCNSPTASPTKNPTKSPTFHPTYNIHSQHIIINNYDYISSRFIAFDIKNIDLSCGGSIFRVQISDNYPYEDSQWIDYTSTTNSGYYVFNLTSIHSSLSYTAPISIKITKRDQYNNKFLIGSRVLQEFIPRQNFDFENNFCVQYTNKSYFSLLAFPYSNMVYLLIISIFFFIACIAVFDSKIGFRRNDHFSIAGIASCFFQVLDMVSDIFFCVAVWYTTKFITHEYYEYGKQQQLALIFILSAICIILPISISLYQLHNAAGTDWLENNRVREWCKSYTKLLFIASIFTGSSFSAIRLFNSNLFGLDVFYMGLTRDDILSFTKRKLQSVVLFENVPQLVLSVWYMIVINQIQTVSVVQIIFSIISIIVTIATILHQRRIVKTQDCIYFELNVSGPSMLQNSKIYKNKTNFLKKYIARNVLGVNAKWVHISKPYGGAVINGIRIEYTISFINESESGLTLECHYKRCLEDIIVSQELAKLLKNKWQLKTLPYIKLNCYRFIESESHKNNEWKLTTGDGEHDSINTDDFIHVNGDIEISLEEGQTLRTLDEIWTKENENLIKQTAGPCMFQLHTI